MNLELNLSDSQKMSRREVYDIIDGERNYQDSKWNDIEKPDGVPDIDKSIAEWLNYIEFHLERAKYNVYLLDKNEALAEVRKVAALAVRCMEIHGCPSRQTLCDNDDNKITTFSCGCSDCNCKNK